MMEALEMLDTYMGTMLIEFHMVSCPPCKKLEAALREFSDETGIPVVKVDLGEKRFDKLSDRFKVTHTPTVVVVNNQVVVARGIPHSKEALARLVAKAS